MVDEGSEGSEIIYKDRTGKYVCVKPKKNTIAQETEEEVDGQKLDHQEPNNNNDSKKVKSTIACQIVEEALTSVSQQLNPETAPEENDSRPKNGTPRKPEKDEPLIPNIRGAERGQSEKDKDCKKDARQILIIYGIGAEWMWGEHGVIANESTGPPQRTHPIWFPARPGRYLGHQAHLKYL